ncbi:MAG: hypothetical protein V1787_01935 [Candidatus Micrarchaeota archaeon]
MAREKAEKTEGGFNWWMVAGAIVILGLVWYYGFQPKPVPPQNVYDPGYVPTAAPTLEPTPVPDALAPDTSGVLLGAPVPANPDADVGPPACGDFNCDANERCDTCAEDCGCAGDEYCNRLNGICYPSE